MTPEQASEIRRLRAEGHSLRAIAEITGIPFGTVAAFAKRDGLPNPDYITTASGKPMQAQRRRSRPPAHHKNIAAAVADLGAGRVARWVVEGADVRGAEQTARAAIDRLRVLGVDEREIVLRLLGGDDGDGLPICGGGL